MPEPAIEIAHPPQIVLRAFNPVLHLALRTPLGSSLKEFMVISFSGRKTGRHFAVPVSAHHIDGELFVLLNAGWKHNFRGGRRADVLYGGKSKPMQGQLISEPAAVAELAHRSAQSYGASKAQRMMGLKFPGGTVPTVAEFTDAAQRLGLAAIRLTPG